MRHAKKPSATLDRRELLKAATVGVAGAAILTQLEEHAWAHPTDQLFVAAYTDQLSYEAGDNVALHVSTSARSYSVEVARLGAKRQIVLSKDNVSGTKQAIPENASSHGCKWDAGFSFPVSREWRSGYYQDLLRTKGNDGSSVEGETFFVVRASEPGKQNKILLQLATNTYNAYNTWGGSSLYGGPKGPSRRVSFDRPYAGFTPGDKFTSLYSGWRRWEGPFVEWAEHAGYSFDFAVNSDLEQRPEILRSYQLVLSVGHDEYWSALMRDHLEAFIAAGGNVAFFSGNTCFWQVRTEDHGRALVSWKADFDQDPVYKSDDHRLLTGTWTNLLVKRPENQLTGVSFSYGGYHAFFGHPGDGGYTIHRPDHWILRGTGLKRGDRLGKQHKIVGYECDGCLFMLEKGLPVPTHEDGTPATFEILGSAPASLSLVDNSLVWVSEGLYGKNTSRRVKQPGAAMLGCFTRGGTVFTTGCTEWVRGLEGRDPQVEQITRNVLNRLANR